MFAVRFTVVTVSTILYKQNKHRAPSSRDNVRLLWPHLEVFPVLVHFHKLLPGTFFPFWICSHSGSVPFEFCFVNESFPWAPMHAEIFAASEKQHQPAFKQAVPPRNTFPHLLETLGREMQPNTKQIGPRGQCAWYGHGRHVMGHTFSTSVTSLALLPYYLPCYGRHVLTWHHIAISPIARVPVYSKFVSSQMVCYY